MEPINIIKTDGGRKRVILKQIYADLELQTMINGHQSTGQPVDETLLLLIQEAISDYFSKVVRPT
ncbi:MAG: hypothetical protein HOD58_06225 [Gammaproteobacteria bacterium]|jgi:hypothetical protein|nr:hypothetical protein [Candidatus Neomarinimicrobiota bacterium]MBT4329505.1 hypothetical protein [Gammaproteobacteria bacterium]MBT5268077.1 hypothetical protein [Candidatus Neomarinimicrobiota bacterium]MBT7082114.1 hypothetical protein [Chloroflexota bacterium]